MHLEMHVFTVRDREGKRVYLPNERWKHIAAEHPNIAPLIERVRETIAHPHITKTSIRDSEVRLHHKHDKQKNAYLVVVVKYLNGDGFVVTSFYTRKVIGI